LAAYNKRMLKLLSQSAFPRGISIQSDTIEQAALRTEEKLEADEAILFDAVSTYKHMRSKFPILIKRGSQLTAIQLRTKAFSSRKHRLMKQGHEIHARWQRYLVDFAYQLYILKKEYPDYSVLPLLIFPDKSGYAQTSKLPQLLQQKKDNSSLKNISVPNQQLLVKLDVSEPISQIQNSTAFAKQHFPRPSFSETLAFLRDTYVQQKKIAPEIGNKCKKCEFRLSANAKEEAKASGFDECWTPARSTLNGEADHVFNLIGPGKRKWIENGKYYQQQVDEPSLPSLEVIKQPDRPITEKMRQALQIYKSRGHQVPREIIRPALAKELRRWEYPIHFLDFEAGNYAIPLRAGRHPYHLIIYQFSCHTLYHDGSWQHHQWVDKLNSDYPSYELVRRLMKVPDINEGTIVQYSNFERYALKTIRNELKEESAMVPDSKWLIQWLESLLNRNDSTQPQPPYMVDLNRQVSRFYYNSNMSDSLGLKEILHAVMCQSSFLEAKYSQPYCSHNFDNFIWWQTDNMDNVKDPYMLLQQDEKMKVGRGIEAMTLFGKLMAGTLSKKERKKSLKSLLRYCELDTLAMMMIYEHWKQRFK